MTEYAELLKPLLGLVITVGIVLLFALRIIPIAADRDDPRWAGALLACFLLLPFAGVGFLLRLAIDEWTRR